MASSGAFGMTRLQKFFAHVALLILCIPALLPMAWMVSTSLKEDKQVFAAGGKGAPPFSVKSLVPNPVKVSNYKEAVQNGNLPMYLGNTLRLCIVAVVGAVLSSAIVAYGFARLYFPGKSLLFMLMISSMAVPAQVTMVPMFSLYRSLGWYGTYLPLMAPAFFGAPFFIFLLTQFYKTLPEELAEAARLDGSGEWTIFTRIMAPLSKSALITCALFQFLWTWNDFLGPLLYLNDPHKYTLAYGLQQFMSARSGQWTQLMAAATLFTLPIIILFFFAQKTFIQGIATTGGKS